VPGFVGRVAELERLEQTLYQPNSCQIVSVLGLGGVGKSRLALEFAYQMKNKHPEQSILWVQAAEQLTFEKDILEIGKKLGIPGIEDDKADTKTLAREWLSNQSEGTWILILDNADDEILWGRRSNPNNLELSLADYLPKTTNGSILVTTRSRRVATFLTGADVVNLDAPSPDEAAKMFMNRLGSPDLAADREALSTLLAKLTYLPLAIVQASAFINETQHPVQTYLKLLDKSEVSLIRLLSKEFGDASRYPNAINPVATTWLISFQRIQKFHPLAATFLSSMACLHEKSIPLSLLLETGTDIDEIDIVDSIAVLTGYAFATRQSRDSNIHGEETYDMHRLVQLAARSWLKNQGLLLKRTKTCTTWLAQRFPTRAYENKSVWTAYFPHARRLCDAMGLEELPERYQLLEKMGLCYMMEGKYDDAVKAHAAVVKWREHAFGGTEDQTLEAYNNIGEALHWGGKWSVAEKYLQQAFNGRKEILGTEHPSTLTSMANLASTYRNQGRWTQAEELEVQVMETRKRVLGPEHPDTLTSMNNLAHTFKSLNRDEDAVTLMYSCMKLSTKVLGPSHHQTQSVLMTLVVWLGVSDFASEEQQTASRMPGAWSD
jgi:hypothetical protein